MLSACRDITDLTLRNLELRWSGSFTRRIASSPHDKLKHIGHHSVFKAAEKKSFSPQLGLAGDAT